MIKLYDKKLHTMADLKREIALKEAEADNYFGSMFSFGGGEATATAADAGSDTGSDNSTDILGIAMDLITSKGLLNKLGVLAVPALKFVGLKVEKRMVLSLGKEILGGYLKWKATEFGAKTAYSYAKKKTAKA